MAQAIIAARRFEGRTRPNPPVGAVIVAGDGSTLGTGAHQRAGEAHAEVNAIDDARARGASAADFAAATIFVTLEPCNHHGRTGPCTEAILAAGLRHVVIGVADPNGHVKGGGAARLAAEGVTVTHATGLLAEECTALIAPFAHFARTGLPYLLHKIAQRRDPATGALTMIPPAGGGTTFTSAAALKLAHEERRRADALITGMGTVLADAPQFTVRHSPDHPAPHTRHLAVVGRGPLPSAWETRQKSLGFDVFLVPTLPEALTELGRRQCLLALLEAGPKLSETAEELGLWEERLVILAGQDGEPDHIMRELNPARRT